MRPVSYLLLLPLIAVLTLAGCASGSPPIAAPRLLPPASLTAPPPETLQEPASPALDDLLKNHIVAAGMYHRLRERFNNLVQWLETTSK